MLEASDGPTTAVPYPLRRRVSDTRVASRAPGQGFSNCPTRRAGAIYVSRPTEEGLEAATKLRAAVQSGADESAIQELIEDVARASTRGRGERVVLGAWQAGGGYIGEAVENGGVFFDTGDEVWQMLKASGVDPWDVNEAFLQRKLNARIERIDFVSGDVGGLLDKYAGIPDEGVPYRVRELRWLIENAEKFDYILTGNRWRLSSLP